MNVRLATSAGFCWGVQRAVDLARRSAKESATPLYTDGPLIHNEQMIALLRTEGIRAMDSGSCAAAERIMIRAHGIPPARRRHLRSLSAELIDATCPDVAKIQGTIRNYARRGYHVLIFGDQGHAEVLGLEGYAEGRGVVVKTVDEVAALPPRMTPVCLVSQSTQFPSAYARIADAVLHRFPDAVIIDTICAATLSRQREVQELAACVDAFVVVGGAHSANTLRLVDLARSLNPTFHIQTGAQLRAADFESFATVGLTAGASTPDFILEDVRARLEHFD